MMSHLLNFNFASKSLSFSIVIVLKDFFNNILIAASSVIKDKMIKNKSFTLKNKPNCCI